MNQQDDITESQGENQGRKATPLQQVVNLLQNAGVTLEKQTWECAIIHLERIVVDGKMLFEKYRAVNATIKAMATKLDMNDVDTWNRLPEVSIELAEKVSTLVKAQSTPDVNLLNKDASGASAKVIDANGDSLTDVCFEEVSKLNGIVKTQSDSLATLHESIQSLTQLVSELKGESKNTWAQVAKSFKGKRALNEELSNGLPSTSKQTVPVGISSLQSRGRVQESNAAIQPTKQHPAASRTDKDCAVILTGLSWNVDQEKLKEVLRSTANLAKRQIESIEQFGKKEKPLTKVKFSDPHVRASVFRARKALKFEDKEVYVREVLSKKEVEFQNKHHADVLKLRNEGLKPKWFGTELCYWKNDEKALVYAPWRNYASQPEVPEPQCTKTTKHGRSPERMPRRAPDLWIYPITDLYSLHATDLMTSCALDRRTSHGLDLPFLREQDLRQHRCRVPTDNMPLVTKVVEPSSDWRDGTRRHFSADIQPSKPVAMSLENGSRQTWTSSSSALMRTDERMKGNCGYLSGLHGAGASPSSTDLSSHVHPAVCRDPTNGTDMSERMVAAIIITPPTPHPSFSEPNLAGNASSDILYEASHYPKALSASTPHASASSPDASTHHVAGAATSAPLSPSSSKKEKKLKISFRPYTSLSVTSDNNTSPQHVAASPTSALLPCSSEPHENIPDCFHVSVVPASVASENVQVVCQIPASISSTAEDRYLCLEEGEILSPYSEWIDTISTSTLQGSLGSTRPPGFPLPLVQDKDPQCSSSSTRTPDMASIISECPQVIDRGFHATRHSDNNAWVKGSVPEYPAPSAPLYLRRKCPEAEGRSLGGSQAPIKGTYGQRNVTSGSHLANVDGSAQVPAKSCRYALDAAANNSRKSPCHASTASQQRNWSGAVPRGGLDCRILDNVQMPFPSSTALQQEKHTQNLLCSAACCPASSSAPELNDFSVSMPCTDWCNQPSSVVNSTDANEALDCSGLYSYHVRRSSADDFSEDLSAGTEATKLGESDTWWPKHLPIMLQQHPEGDDHPPLSSRDCGPRPFQTAAEPSGWNKETCMNWEESSSCPETTSVALQVRSEAREPSKIRFTGAQCSLAEPEYVKHAHMPLMNTEPWSSNRCAGLDQMPPIAYERNTAALGRCVPKASRSLYSPTDTPNPPEGEVKRTTSVGRFTLDGSALRSGNIEARGKRMSMVPRATYSLTKPSMPSRDALMPHSTGEPCTSKRRSTKPGECPQDAGRKRVHRCISQQRDPLAWWMLLPPVRQSQVNAQSIVPQYQTHYQSIVQYTEEEITDFESLAGDSSSRQPLGKEVEARLQSAQQARLGMSALAAEPKAPSKSPQANVGTGGPGSCKQLQFATNAAVCTVNHVLAALEVEPRPRIQKLRCSVGTGDLGSPKQLQLRTHESVHAQTTLAGNVGPGAKPCGPDLRFDAGVADLGVVKPLQPRAFNLGVGAGKVGAKPVKQARGEQLEPAVRARRVAPKDPGQGTKCPQADLRLGMSPPSEIGMAVPEEHSLVLNKVWLTSPLEAASATQPTPENPLYCSGKLQSGCRSGISPVSELEAVVPSSLLQGPTRPESMELEPSSPFRSELSSPNVIQNVVQKVLGSLSSRGKRIRIYEDPDGVLEAHQDRNTVPDFCSEPMSSGSHASPVTHRGESPACATRLPRKANPQFGNLGTAHLSSRSRAAAKVQARVRATESITKTTPLSRVQGTEQGCTRLESASARGAQTGLLEGVELAATTAAGASPIREKSGTFSRKQAASSVRAHLQKGTERNQEPGESCTQRRGSVPAASSDEPGGGSSCPEGTTLPTCFGEDYIIGQGRARKFNGFKGNIHKPSGVGGRLEPPSAKTLNMEAAQPRTRQCSRSRRGRIITKCATTTCLNTRRHQFLCEDSQAFIRECLARKMSCPSDLDFLAVAEVVDVAWARRQLTRLGFPARFASFMLLVCTVTSKGFVKARPGHRSQIHSLLQPKAPADAGDLQQQLFNGLGIDISGDFIVFDLSDMLQRKKRHAVRRGRFAPDVRDWDLHLDDYRMMFRFSKELPPLGVKRAIATLYGRGTHTLRSQKKRGTSKMVSYGWYCGANIQRSGGSFVPYNANMNKMDMVETAANYVVGRTEEFCPDVIKSQMTDRALPKTHMCGATGLHRMHFTRNAGVKPHFDTQDLYGSYINWSSIRAYLLKGAAPGGGFQIVEYMLNVLVGTGFVACHIRSDLVMHGSIAPSAAAQECGYERYGIAMCCNKGNMTRMKTQLREGKLCTPTVDHRGMKRKAIPNLFRSVPRA